MLETTPCRHKETHTWNQTTKIRFPGHYDFPSLALTVELVAKNADVIGSCRVFPSLTNALDASEHTLQGVGGQVCFVCMQVCFVGWA